MSRRRDESYPTDEQIERLAGQAFGDLGEMVPTTEREVAKLEAELGENLPSPPRFEPRAVQERSSSDPGSDQQATPVRQLSRAWRIPRTLGYSASAAVGASKSFSTRPIALNTMGASIPPPLYPSAHALPPRTPGATKEKPFVAFVIIHQEHQGPPRKNPSSLCPLWIIH